MSMFYDFDWGPRFVFETDHFQKLEEEDFIETDNCIWSWLDLDNVKEDLTTPQKMIIFLFLEAIGQAEEVECINP